MTRRIRYSAAARRDLAAAKAWSVRTFGNAQTVRYFADLRDALERLRANPGLARDVSQIDAGLKSIVAGSHVAYLRIDSRSIDVIRILHGRMDPERHLS